MGLAQHDIIKVESSCAIRDGRKIGSRSLIRINTNDNYNRQSSEVRCFKKLIFASSIKGVKEAFELYFELISIPLRVLPKQHTTVILNNF